MTRIQEHPFWLIVITNEGRQKRAKGNKRLDIFRTRVWLRTPGENLLIRDQGGFVTVRGAEWDAYGALARVIETLRADR
jgi:hypothetical protein